MDLHNTLIYKTLLKQEQVDESDFKKFLKEAGDAYYTSEPIISDGEFDTFRSIFTKNFSYDPIEIGTTKTMNKGFEKAQHDLPMGSLTEFDPNTDVEKDIKKWLNKYADEEEMCASEKLDGISVSVRWEEGKLVQAITRGDGSEGDDITRNVLKIARVPSELPVPFTGFLRGEIALKKSVRLEHFPHYANERNGAGGLVKRLDGVGIEHLDIFFFKYHGEENFKTEYESLEYVRDVL